MGNAQSGLVYRKLSKEIPPVKKMGHDNEWVYRDLGMKAFVDEDDRKQFICKPPRQQLAVANGYLIT